MDVNLVLFKRDGTQKTFALPSNLTVIGRRHDCDLSIPLMEVSRRHCQLELSEDSLKVRDLGSRNGTFVNDQTVNGDTLVKAGDYLKIGPLVFQLQIDGKPENPSPPNAEQARNAPEDVILSEDDEELDLSDLDIDDSEDDFLSELEEL